MFVVRRKKTSVTSAAVPPCVGTVNPFATLANDHGEEGTPRNLSEVGRRREAMFDKGDQVAFRKLAEACRKAS